MKFYVFIHMIRSFNPGQAISCGISASQILNRYLIRSLELNEGINDYEAPSVIALELLLFSSIILFVIIFIG